MKDSLIEQVSWVGTDHVRGPIRGLVLRFSGLGGGDIKRSPDAHELEWAEAGALVVTPYHNPWAWMNPATREFIDDLIASLFERHQLKKETPIISTGGSMGGHGALLYACLAKHPVAACLAVSPVCDLLFHYGERPDLPRTMHSAYGTYGDLEKILKENSPLHLIERMPDIPYLFIHGDKDMSVAKDKHSDPMVAALRKGNLKVEYIEQPGLGHPNPWTHTAWRRAADFAKGFLRM